jgi:hypothetical protein
MRKLALIVGAAVLAFLAWVTAPVWWPIRIQLVQDEELAAVQDDLLVWGEPLV